MYWKLLLSMLTAGVCLETNLPEYCGRVYPPYEPFNASREPEGTEVTLKQVQVITRHGDRLVDHPKPCWENDTAVYHCNLTSASYIAFSNRKTSCGQRRNYRQTVLDKGNAFQGNCLTAHLTDRGENMVRRNGKWLRKAYVDTLKFLPHTLPKDDVYIRYRSISRILQTAEALMDGMYPSQQEPNATAIDVYTIDKTMDILTPNMKICPKLGQYLEEWNKDERKIEHDETVTKPLLERVKEAFEIKREIELHDLSHLVDCVRVHQCHKKPLPSGVTDSLIDEMVDELMWQWYNQYKYPTPVKHCKVGMGFLVKELLQNMEDVMNGKGKKFLLYSGHDWTQMPLFGCFEINYKWPRYASMVQIELFHTKRENTTEYKVRFLWNGKEVKIPLCEDYELCPMSVLKPYLDELIPHNPKKDCKPTAKTRVPREFIPSAFKRMVYLTMGHSEI